MSFREKIKSRLARLRRRFGIGERRGKIATKRGKEIPSVERAEELSKAEKTTSIIVPEEMWNKLKAYCTKNNYTLSDVMTLAVLFMIRYGESLEDVINDWDRQVSRYGVRRLFEK